MSTAAEQAPKDAEVTDRKRKQEEDVTAVASSEPESKVPKVEGDETKPMKRGPISKAREIRLEQNRKAARESRRRKKVMIEELQRSVIFFSRSNGVLKQQNDDFQRMLLQAQAQVAQIEGRSSTAPAPQPSPTNQADNAAQQQQSQAETAAAQALYESQGFPPAAARAAAQTMGGSTASSDVVPAPASSASQNVPQMQPGATMQAMANFQQAATAAMQAAVQGMQGIPGLSVSALTATPSNSANTQQAYNDTMTALAMQQAAAATGQRNFFQQNPFMPLLAWQGQGPAAAAPSAHQAQTSQP